MSITELFGKYEVSGIVENTGEDVQMTLSNEGTRLARVRFDLADDYRKLSASYLRMPNNSEQDFKQLFEDAKSSFQVLGLNLQAKVEHSDHPELGPQDTASYLISADLTFNLYGEGITNTVELTDGVLQLYDKLSKQFPEAKKDETFFTSLGQAGQGSYVLEVEDQVYVIMQVFESLMLQSAHQIQISSNKIDGEEKVERLRKQVVEFLNDYTPNNVFINEYDDEFDLSHTFSIDLINLPKIEKLSSNSVTLFLG